MIIGPLTAWMIKRIDEAIQRQGQGRLRDADRQLHRRHHRRRMASSVCSAIGPIVGELDHLARHGVKWLVSNNLLPLASIIIEPAKVLFLNNAINHGVLSPLGVARPRNRQVDHVHGRDQPRSRPRHLARLPVVRTPALRPTAPGAIIIHFFGGIHEIYFPYMLMKPQLILATIAGGTRPRSPPSSSTPAWSPRPRPAASSPTWR